MTKANEPGGLRTKRIYAWILALIVPVFAVVPALAYPIEEHAADTAVFHVFRAVLFSAARDDGWIFPRWVQAINNGLGGPLFSFYPPAMFYALDFLNSLGIAHTLAYRILVVLALVVASTGMFKLGLTLFRRADAALIAAVAYTYAPYMLRDFFERGSPQGLATAILPWALWAMLWVAEQPSGARFALTSALWAAIILSHNLSGLVFLPAIAVFLGYIALRFGRKRLLLGCGALLVGLLLTSFHVLPFVAERGYIQLENASKDEYVQPALNPLTLAELVMPPAAFDSSRDGNTMGQTVGFLNVLILLSAPVVAVWLWRRKQKEGAWLVVGLGFLAALVIWLQLDVSTQVWETLSFTRVVQFRWRLLAPIGLVAAVILGYILANTSDRRRKILIPVFFVGLIAIELYVLFPDMLRHYTVFPQTLQPADVARLTQEAGTTSLTGHNELLPRWRQSEFTKEEATSVASTPMANLPAGGRIIGGEKTDGAISIELESPVPFQAALHLLYFPGWSGYVDGVKQNLTPMEPSGYTLLDVPAGVHTIDLRYEGTTVQHIADLLSLFTVVGLIVLAIVWRPHRQTSQPSAITYLTPHWWIPIVLIGLAVLKVIWVDPSTHWLRCTSTPERVCGAQTSVDIPFSHGHRLRGYTVPTYEVEPGAILRVNLYWEGERDVTPPLLSFVHLRNSQSNWPVNPDTGQDIWAQEDHLAPAGLLANQFLPGKLYQDEFRIRVPSDIPPGEYFLEMGWFDPITGEQLDPNAESVQPPLNVLWRSILLPSIQVR